MVTALLPLPRLRGATELLDRRDNSDKEIRENLRDLERLNRYFGGVHAVLLHLGRMVGGHSPGPVTILDIATGGADIPRGYLSLGQDAQADCRHRSRRPRRSGSGCRNRMVGRLSGDPTATGAGAALAVPESQL